MVDLKAKPFYLNDTEIRWVEETLAGMTLEEKLGQLFILINMNSGITEEEIRKTLAEYGQGAHRWKGGKKDKAYQQNALFQKYSKVPLLIAANADEGGNSSCPEGTFVATGAEAGAAEGTETAYHMGLVAGREARAVGANWIWSPVVDMARNFRNTSVNTRSFGIDADRVLENARAYIKGVREADPHLATTVKHFPGDGIDELDPHLSLPINDMRAEEWYATTGKIYKTLIDEGLDSVIVGHIACPALDFRKHPDMKQEEILPATLDPILMQEVLRGDLGFNGLIISDASHMVGMASMMPLEEAVPKSIAAGLDMFLFCDHPEECIGYLKAGLLKGWVSQERIQEALLRILGLKAKLHLYEDAVKIPDVQGLDLIGCEEHKAFTYQAADAGVTLVKDTRHYLPWDVKNKKKALLVYNYATPNSKAFSGDSTRQLITEELERVGFDVTQAPSFYDLECQGVKPENGKQMVAVDYRKDFKEKYDVVFVFVNVKGNSTSHSMHLNWSYGHSNEMPWYISEVPTIAVSLNYTTHLIDFGQMHTYINAYSSKRDNVRAAVEKIVGRSPFKGKANESVFCGRWDTRL